MDYVITMSNSEPRAIRKAREKKKKKLNSDNKNIKSLPTAILGSLFVSYFMFKVLYLLIQFEWLPPTTGLYQLFWIPLFENLLFVSAGAFLFTYGMSTTKQQLANFCKGPLPNTRITEGTLSNAGITEGPPLKNQKKSSNFR